MGVGEHLGAVRLHAAADHRGDVVARPLLLDQGVHGHVPALVGAEAPDLEDQLAPGEGGAQVGHQLRVGPLDPVPRDAVGDHERVHGPVPHHVLHVAGDGGDLRAEVEPAPVDAVEPHHVVGVPEQDGLVAQPFGPEAVGELAGGVGGVPLLGQDGGETAGRRRGLDQVGDDVAGELLVPVDELGLLSLVDAAPVVGREPLAPAVEREILGGRFVRGQIGVADEHQVRPEALAGQLERQLLHAHPEPAGHGVLVGSLEGEQDELQRLGRQAEKIGHGASRAWVGARTTVAYPVLSNHARFPAFVLLCLLCTPPKGWKGTKGMAIKYLLPEDRIPTSWYNVAADLPAPPPPPLHPGTLQPAGPDDLAPLFPMGLIMQEMSTERLIEIPDEVREIYKLWRPTPLIRAARWEKALGTPAKIYFKYEGVSPAGSHKPNTAVAQAWYNKQEGITKLTTETGAGQWGSRPRPRLPAVRHGMPGLHGEGLLLPEALPPQHDPAVGRGSHPQPLRHHRVRPRDPGQDPDSPGSLGIAISEAVEVAAQRDDTHYSLGSVLNHVLLHQTVIGQEALEQMELAGAYPDFVVACVGGGSNFAGIAFPFVGENIKKGKKTRIIAVEPAACPTMTKGIYAFDYGDTAKLTPLCKMDTLGHDFIPPGIHAGGLRYHGMAPMVSHCHQLGLIEARLGHADRRLLGRRVSFARSEGIIPAPES